MFEQHIIDTDIDYFDELSKATEFEDIIKGRQGGVLVGDADKVPLVRTTTKYLFPAQTFKKIHLTLIKQIQKTVKQKVSFNNALIELYDVRYRKMGFHTDQSQDLEDDSYICLFSCYNTDTPKDVRTLHIKDKRTNETFDVELKNNSIVLFSTEINRKHLHKIILEKCSSEKSKELWLGVTFRLSKTFIKFIYSRPVFYKNDKPLRIADDDDKKLFYKERGKENKKTYHKYPDMDFTLSTSDLVKPSE